MAKKASIKPISASEFDRMFDDGEDVSAYIDWDTEVRGFPARLPDAKSKAKAAVARVASTKSGAKRVKAS